MKMRRTILVLFGLISCFTGIPALAVETTLYVGKHFEVRDYDQPTKYVFNGDTRIARITGSLSTNTRIQRFRLRSGWNLLSLAVSATNLSDQLQRPGVINLARAWNPQTGNYSSVPQVAPAGTVLWVNASTNSSIAVVGTYTDPVNRQVSAGATYLASTGLEAWTPTLPPSVAAWSFDSQPPVRRSFSGGGSSFNPQPIWHARLTGDLSSINDLPNTFPPGEVIYVINHAPFELEIPDAALRVRYYHQDHLGSSSVMTDANGALVEETAFYPFGIPRHEHRLRSLEEHYKFTQKERDRESGLFYFEARYLTAGLARFAVPDPKYAHPDTLVKADAAGFFSNPQKLNLYAYARNNPLNHVDPTGLDDKTPTALERAQRFVEDLAGLPDGYTGPSVWGNIETMVDRGRQQGPDIHTDARPSSPPPFNPAPSPSADKTLSRCKEMKDALKNLEQLDQLGWDDVFGRSGRCADSLIIETSTHLRKNYTVNATSIDSNPSAECKVAQKEYIMRMEPIGILRQNLSLLYDQSNCITPDPPPFQPSFGHAHPWD
jgi:RHS repeat-associated protein